MKVRLAGIILLILVVIIFEIFLTISKKYNGSAHTGSTNTEIIESTQITVNKSPVDSIFGVENLEQTESSTPSSAPTEPTEATGTTEQTELVSPTESTEKVPEEIIDTEKEENSNLISLGEFRLTAYCPCVECCGKWSGGATASGVMPVANHTIAVDTKVIPFGTEVIINGKTYVAEDTGSAIYGNRIDIYFNTHEEALEFGVQYAEVFVIDD